MLGSVVCRFEHFETEWFARWATALRMMPQPDAAPRYHRKTWEFAAVLQTLEERGKLQPGMRGLGFAVGTEPLPALLASRGVGVVASDLAGSTRTARIWARTRQHGASAADLYRAELVDRAAFDARVTFQPLDMNGRWPFAPASFDFVWSCCAFEHLGSLERGLRFVERAAELLKPGGVAVHTTEYNCSSNEKTVERGGGVLYRRRDIEGLDLRLRRSMRALAKPDFWPGDHAFDRVFDVPPYGSAPGRQHVKLLIDGFVCTSMLLAVLS